MLEESHFEFLVHSVLFAELKIHHLRQKNLHQRALPQYL